MFNHHDFSALITEHKKRIDEINQLRNEYELNIAYIVHFEKFIRTYWYNPFKYITYKKAIKKLTKANKLIHKQILEIPYRSRACSNGAAEIRDNLIKNIHELNKWST